MKYLYVTDPLLVQKIIADGNPVLQKIFDIEQNPIWVFEYNPLLPFCFDINDTSIRRACVVSDKLIMRF